MQKTTARPAAALIHILLSMLEWYAHKSSLATDFCGLPLYLRRSFTSPMGFHYCFRGCAAACLTVADGGTRVAKRYLKISCRRLHDLTVYVACLRGCLKSRIWN